MFHSLHRNPANKLLLLQQALSYYEQSKLYMQDAAFSTDLTILHEAPPSSSSISSSIRSSVDSIFSYTSSVSSTTPSPTSPSYDTTSNITEMHKHIVSNSSASCDSEMKPVLSRIRKRVCLTPLPKLASGAHLAYAGDNLLIKAFLSPPSNLRGSLSTSFDDRISIFLLSRSLVCMRNLITI
jgi:hypothetical protein